MMLRRENLVGEEHGLRQGQVLIVCHVHGGERRLPLGRLYLSSSYLAPRSRYTGMGTRLIKSRAISPAPASAMGALLLAARTAVKRHS